MPRIDLRGNSEYSVQDFFLSALEVVPDKPGTIQVFAVLGGIYAVGITGVEFAISGLPEGWVAVVTKAQSANILLGNPFEGRVNVAFPTCQLGMNNKVPLLSATIIATSDIQDKWLWVVASDPPTNPNFLWPIVTRTPRSPA